MSVRRALICAPVMPEFDRESGSRRVYDLITFLREAGWAVSFVAENVRGGERYAEVLQQEGVAVYRGFGPPVERLLTRGRIDLAMFAFWYLAEAQMSMVRRLSPDTRVVIDTIDLHFVRNARRLFQAARSSQDDADGGALDGNYGAQMARELNTYAAADGVLAVSRKEAELIADLSDDAALCHIVPDCEELAASEVPFTARRGVTFIGNFRHPPNVGAAEFLCREVVPRIDPKLLREHPVYVVGNALNDRVRALADGHPHVRMVGWVPSVLPYLERARISVVPLRYGAGTKRKLVQSLMLGTPAVTTTAGTEGMGLRHDEHVLVADDADRFASSVATLLSDPVLWQKLSHQGRNHVVAWHGRESVRAQFGEAVAAVLAKPAKRSAPSGAAKGPVVTGLDQYRLMVERVRRAVAEAVPEGSTAAVITRGDDDLLRLEGRRGWHFPQGQDGSYAGHYPADGAAAVRHLEELRKKGARFLVLPNTAFWWLEHYRELKEHLERHCLEVLRRDDTCVIYDLVNNAGRHQDALRDRATALQP